MNHFHVIDYVIFSIVLLLSLGIGIYSAFSRRRQTTTAEYLIGNRQLPLAPVALSICVSIISTNALIGLPAEIYNFGIQYVISILVMPLGGFIVAITLVPIIYPLNIISIHKYLEMRYDSRIIKWYGTFIQLIFQTLYVGTVLFGPAISLEPATGVPAWISLIITAVIGISYTTIGGMRGVVWTDTFQSIIMILGCLVIIIIGTVKVGSISDVWDLNNEWKHMEVDLSADPTRRLTLWSTIFGGTAYMMGILGANQPCVQRTCALSNITLARWSTVLGACAITLFGILTSLAGLVIFAYYAQQGCDPVSAKYVSNMNQILPYFIMDVLSYPGLPGLLFASLFSASLSSLSSSINSMSAVFWADILETNFKSWSESQRTLCNKGLTIIFGLCCFAFSLAMLFVGGSLLAIAASITGALMGPLLGVFLLAAFVPFSNWKGAFVGGIISAAINIWMMLGSIGTGTHITRLQTPTYGCHLEVNENHTMPPVIFMISDISTPPMDHSKLNITFPTDTGLEKKGFVTWIYSMSFFWYPLIGMSLSIILGMFISLITCYTKADDINPKYLINCVVKRKLKMRSRYEVVAMKENQESPC